MLQLWNRWIQDHPRLAGGVLFLTTYVVYCGTLSNLLVHDDIPQVLENPYLRNPGLWTRIFTGSVWSFRGPAQRDNMYRPLQFIVYWALYRLKGPNPAVFHLALLLFYAAAVWLVFRLACKLLPNPLAAFVGALLWALHPLHVETVAWISALPDLGAAYFYLLAFLLFVRAEQSDDRGIGRYLLAAAAFLPALFFKEMALTFPLTILVYWFYFPGKTSWKSKVLHWTMFAAAVAVYLAIRIAVLGRFSEAHNLFRPTWRLGAVAAGLLGQHARLFFWPAHLSIFRSIGLAESLHSLWPEVALLGLLAALLLRKRQPMLGFLIIWWGVTLLPCLDVRQVNLPVADRFSFLPTVGLCLALACLALDGLPNRLARPKAAPAFVVVLGLLMALWTVQDVRSVRRWHDNVSLWDQAYLASPNSALAHMLHGVVLQQRDNKMDAAAQEYRLAIKLNLASERPLAGVTTDCYVLLGQVASIQGRVQEAIDDYNQALRVVPGNSLAYKSAGMIYLPRGDYARARVYFQKAVDLDPQEVEVRFDLGICLLKLGEPRQAAAQFRAARETDATYVEAYAAEARALEAAGDKAEAARVRALIPKQ
ncbi:MAG: tetratricopeptide repeat protein [Acidobacteriota bacterium]|nr:tetratricopeptide repeat protein [Acidobacteriota bacterium]